ncbi:MAG: hypothetical protein ACRDWY_07365 [Actinomycetes bacterium]
MAIYVAASFAMAAIWALMGTNVQAALSRQRLLEDEDPRVAVAGRLWRPLQFRWLKSAKRRRAAEVEFRDDPIAWRRYQRLITELFAWNALESSVAIATPAALIALVTTWTGNG